MITYYKIPLLAIAGIFLIASLEAAYAQPLDDVSAILLDDVDSGASVQLAWNHDNAVIYYEVGCVSCMPNFSENTDNDEIVLSGVTSLENGKAIFYVIAYDDADEVIVVKQVLLELR